MSWSGVTAHVAGGGVLSDTIYVAVPLLIVGVMILGESRKWAVGLLAAAAIIGGVGVFDIVRAPDARSSRDISVTVRSPVTGQTIPVGAPVTVDITVTGIKIVPVGVVGNRPDEGHLHTYINGQLYSMWGTGVDDNKFKIDAPGQHTIRIELTSNDHRSLSPPVEQTIDVIAR